jgi:NAD(P)H-hydrate repair Nnr-like enzyme with NAD(P)H-hydrate dehydratase domain
MATTFWHKQTGGKPLFPDLLWSRPETKRSAGKLLIVGGNAHGIAAPAEAYQQALAAGVGVAKVVLPDATKKTVGPLLESVEYAPSTPSGSFSQKALAELLELSAWADGVLLPGDLGRNSETAILVEKYLQKAPAFVTLTKDAANYAISIPLAVINRPNTLLVVTMAELQKLFSGSRQTTAITFGIDLLALVNTLHAFTEKYQVAIIVRHENNLIVAAGGQVSTTPTELGEDDMWRVKIAAYASVWQFQNPSKPFESITTSLLL